MGDSGRRDPNGEGIPRHRRHRVGPANGKLILRLTSIKGQDNCSWACTRCPKTGLFTAGDGPATSRRVVVHMRTHGGLWWRRWWWRLVERLRG